MSVYKKFDQKLFNENDVSARLAILSHMDSQGLFCIENDDKYGPDLILYRGLSPYSYIECEIKRVWSGPSLPWDTVQLPVRKEKFLKLGLPTEFYIINKELTHCIVIPDFVLAKLPKVEVRNVYIPDGELFWQVPLSECILLKLGVSGND
jgi:hypothetical protein